MKAKTKNPSKMQDEPANPVQGGTDTNPSQDGADDGSETMSDDERAAFEKIMGDIEGSGASAGDAEADEQTSVAPEPESAEDFSAALEKVAQEAAAVGSVSPTEGNEDEPDDGLDEQQQKAFESIMAQIDGGGASDSDATSNAPATAAPEPEPEDDFAAELEKVAREADAVEEKSAPATASAPSDDELDVEQRKAFESIMAQIEEKEPKDAVPDPVASATPIQEKAPAGPSIDQADEKTHDNADDIERMLSEIAPVEDEAPLPETDIDRPAATPGADDKPAKTVLEENRAVNQSEDRDPVPQDSPSAGLSKVGLKAQSAPVAESLAGASEPTPNAKTPQPSGRTAPQALKPLAKFVPTVGTGIRRAMLASVVVTLLLAVAGYFYWNQTKPTDVEVVTAPSEVIEAAVPTVVPVTAAPAVQGPSDQSRLETVAENLDRLRDELIAKQAEIEELRRYYQAGIDAEIQAIVDTLGQANRGPTPFTAAMADPHISLGLAAIQRRDTYLRKLESPINELLRDSEALLFFSRKAALLGLMAGKTSDIDVDGFIQQADEMMAGHRQALAQLNIDDVPASPLSMESIWQDIEKRLPAKALARKSGPAVAQSDNAAIWKAICNGDFSQNHKLTALSPEAAGCLAAWEGKDLFLNGVTELTPEAARQLAAWPGEWLGLNGLTQLSPEAAAHLAQWKGKGLSLNGLDRLSPRVVAILSEWQGDRIELVNVKHMAHWENSNTRLFLSEALQRKLNLTRK